jgi:FAD/FMN-containing dehydrogenase
MLHDLLPPDRILTGDRILTAYRRDMLAPWQVFPMPSGGWMPKAVVRPISTEEVSAVMSSGLAVLPWGGGTNLVGACSAMHGEVLMDLSLMNRVLEIRAERARVQAGATLASVERAAKRRGLMLGHDPWTVDYATVGGAIGTDGVGYLAPLCGPMSRLVLGLTAVLADGTIVSKRPARKTSTGFNLASLFAGTEGTLAILTEAALQLRPLPEVRELRAYSFSDFASGFRAACEIVQTGPSVLDLVEGFEDGMRYFPIRDYDPQPTLYLAFEGVREIVAAQIRAAERRLKKAKRLPPKHAREYWDSRHDIAKMAVESRSKPRPFMQGIRFDYLHVALPLDQVLNYRAAVLKLFRSRRVLPVEDGVWVHPELYSLAFLRPRQNDEQDTRELREALDQALRLAQTMGGSMEYVHGVGAKLGHLLPDKHGAALDVYRRIKKALDPEGRLPALGRGYSPRKS